jgi:hypothetical protein
LCHCEFISFGSIHETIKPPKIGPDKHKNKASDQDVYTAIRDFHQEMNAANPGVAVIGYEQREIDSEEGFGDHEQRFIAPEQRFIEPEIKAINPEHRHFESEQRNIDPEQREIESEQPFGGAEIQFIRSEQGFGKADQAQIKGGISFGGRGQKFSGLGGFGCGNSNAQPRVGAGAAHQPAALACLDGLCGVS